MKIIKSLTTFGIDSFFYQGGAGVKYNLSRRIDIELE
jgi:hypothetical protein